MKTPKSAENLVEKANVQAESIKKEKMYRLKKKFLELKAEHDNNIQQREKKMQEAEKEQRTKKTSLMMSFLKSGN